MSMFNVNMVDEQLYKMILTTDSELIDVKAFGLKVQILIPVRDEGSNCISGAG